MSDSHATAAAEHGHGDDHAHGHEQHISDKTFMKVFGALLVCTALSYGTNLMFGSSSLIHASNAVVNFLLIGAIACLKATLVMYFFMHLKIDWRKVFVFLIPICILAPMVIIVLWPDIVLAWRLLPETSGTP
jgi:caa(3)-type oxidase subunit IV